MIGQYLRGCAIGKLVLGIRFWVLGSKFKVAPQLLCSKRDLRFDRLRVRVFGLQVARCRL